MTDGFTKPKNVYLAQGLLFLWTVFTCVYGVYDTWKNLPEIQLMINTLQGTDFVSLDTLSTGVVVVYFLIALMLIGFVFQIGEGRKWARSSFLWGWVLQAAWTLGQSHQQPIVDYWSDGLDLGLQLIALYLLYEESASSWFTWDKKA